MMFGNQLPTNPQQASSGFDTAATLATAAGRIGVGLFRASQGLPPEQQPQYIPPPPPAKNNSGLIAAVVIGVGAVALAIMLTR